VARTRRELAWVAYDKAVQGAFRDVSDVLSSRLWLTEQLAIAEAALAAQTERARLSQLRFDHGASAFLEVLDAQRDLLQAQQQVVQQRRALLSNHVAFYAALGGGSLALFDAVATSSPASRSPRNTSSHC
jgi:multidrug efflux system outer membrane protein